MSRSRNKDRTRYDYKRQVKSEASIPQVTYGMVQQVYEMYGEYLDNLAKPYPKELVEEARKKLEKK
jgi:hypothetical protein